MTGDDLIEEEYGENAQGNPPEVQPPPVREYVPPGERVSPLKWIVVFIGVIAIIFLLIFAATYFMMSPLVGKWHITSVEIEGYGNSSADFYMVFYANGTGKSYGSSEYYHFEGKFTWKDLGNGRVRIESDNSTTVLNYTVSGNKIDLSQDIEILGHRYVIHYRGTRVS